MHTGLLMQNSSNLWSKTPSHAAEEAAYVSAAPLERDINFCVREDEEDMNQTICKKMKYFAGFACWQPNQHH